MTELATVLWNPRGTTGKVARGEVGTGVLVLTVIGIDLVLYSALWPLFSTAAAKTLPKHSGFASDIWIVIAVSLGFSSLINILLGAYLALLLCLATVVLGGTAGWRRILEIVLIGSAPELLSRIVRVLLMC